MPNQKGIKLASQVAAGLAFVGLLALWANYKIHRIPLPKYEKLADCTIQSLSFPLGVRYHPPYQFLLGLPHTSTGLLTFQGEMQVRQSTGMVVRFPISSGDLTPCNWLDRTPGLSGYILTWSLTNALSDILVRGQSYDVRVTFSQAPPAGSTLWLSSIGKVGEP